MDHSTMCLEGLEVPVVQVNTVVIGTGSAGYCAADRLAQFGQDDVLVVADKVNGDIAQCRLRQTDLLQADPVREWARLGGSDGPYAL